MGNIDAFAQRGLGFRDSLSTKLKKSLEGEVSLEFSI